MKAKTYARTFLCCPACGKETSSRIDHLFGGRLPYSFGPWYCDQCGARFSGSVLSPDNIELDVMSGTDGRRSRALVLLRLEPKERPVYFVLDTHSYGNEPDANKQDHARYFYEEHSCPTNWIGETRAVIQDGDTDPHGFLDFVRTVEVPLDFDGDDDNQWPFIFPEAFDGPIIDADRQAALALK
jgi:ribosomal protein L37AE/L43A